jgi:hypothetical protein
MKDASLSQYQQLVLSKLDRLEEVQDKHTEKLEALVTTESKLDPNATVQ